MPPLSDEAFQKLLEEPTWTRRADWLSALVEIASFVYGIMVIVMVLTSCGAPALRSRSGRSRLAALELLPRRRGHDAVAPAVLRLLERGVCCRDEARGRAVRRERCRAEARGDGDPLAALGLDLEPLQLAADAL